MEDAMSFTARETKEFEKYVREAYSSDPILLEKYHVKAGSSVDVCVQDTVNVLLNNTYPDFKFYVVEENENFIGYFGQELHGKYLTTIYVTPAMRPRKKEFWDLLTKNMQSSFVSAIYSHNLPCIGFYSKVGTKQQEINNVTTFRFGV